MISPDGHNDSPDTAVAGAKWFAAYDPVGSAPTAAAELLADRYSRLASSAERVRERATGKRIRKLRVSTRRADQAVRFAGALIEPKAARKLRRRLRSVRRAGGAVRRCDLYIERMVRLIGTDGSSDVQPAATAVVGRMAAERTAAIGGLMRTLEGWSPAAPPLRDPPASATPATLAAGMLRDAASKFQQRSAGVALEVGPLHDVRLRAKRLRYTAEAAAPVIGDAAAGELIRAVVPLQDELGRLNDVAELADELAGAMRHFSAIGKGGAAMLAGAERMFLAASAERDRRLVRYAQHGGELIRPITDALDVCTQKADAAAERHPEGTGTPLPDQPADPKGDSGLRLTGDAGWGIT